MVWTVGVSSSAVLGAEFTSPLIITLLCPVALGTGAQSVVTGRDAGRSDCSNKYEGVR